MLELLPKTREMWRFGGLKPKTLLARTVRGFRRHGLDSRSAQSAYYGLMLPRNPEQSTKKSAT